MDDRNREQKALMTLRFEIHESSGRFYVKHGTELLGPYASRENAAAVLQRLERYARRRRDGNDGTT